MFLLDINVLFAALNETHAGHPKVTRWLANIEKHASCGLTQIGTFRLLILAPAMLNRPLKSSDAHQAIARFTNSEHHTFIHARLYPALMSVRREDTMRHTTTI